MVVVVVKRCAPLCLTRTFVNPEKVERPVATQLKSGGKGQGGRTYTTASIASKAVSKAKSAHMTTRTKRCQKAKSSKNVRMLGAKDDDRMRGTGKGKTDTHT